MLTDNSSRIGDPVSRQKPRRATSSKNYRPEIDGLRAVAVVAVILFHIDESWLPGGFLGVDVFFVISGYLITSILLRDLRAGTLSFSHFYERRARRILPALLVVVLACVPLAWVTMDPGEMLDFGRSVLSQLLFASNILFWTEAGYFAAPSETVPLLHTWSLAVEEQFYLLFPAVLLVGWRLVQRQLLGALALLALLSLFLAQRYVQVDPSGAFYLLPFRGWELLAGALLAVWDPEGKGQTANIWTGLAATVGLALVLLSLARFDVATPHPSLHTVPLVMGTCLLVRYGGGGPVFRMLSSKPAVGLGLVSYSLYLWHWPLLVFTDLYYLGDAPDAVLLAAAGLSFPLAWATWKFVETPARRAPIIGLRQLAAGLALGASLVGASGVLILATGGLPGRLDYPDGLLASFDREPTVGTCIDNPGAHEKPDAWFCELGPVKDGDIDFIVTGDSHAYAALPAFRELANRRGVRAVAISDSGCPPLLGVEPLRGDQAETNCRLLNERVLAFAQRERPRAVYLLARWTYYTAYDQQLRETSTGDAPVAENRRLALLSRAIVRTAAAYRSMGVNPIAMGQVPEQEYSPRRVYRAVYVQPGDKDERLRTFSVGIATHRAKQAAVDETLKQTPGLGFVDPATALCTDVCPMGNAKTAFYFDIDHLSVRGALKLIPLL